MNDAVGDNPAYEATPQSSAASIPGKIADNQALQPNGKPAIFSDPSSNPKRGFLQRAFGIVPSDKSSEQNPDLYYTDASGKLGPEDSLAIERYDTPPESFDPRIFPVNAQHVGALPPGTDSNMNKLRDPKQHRTGGSQDRPLELGYPNQGRDIPDHLSPHLPSNVTNSPPGVSKQQPLTHSTQPYTAHPDYPHYGNLAPPFSVSADSIIYMDLDDLDDFFLRQNRKPQPGFIVPDSGNKFTPTITKLYRPETFQSREDIANPSVPVPPDHPPAVPFQPITNTATPGEPEPGPTHPAYPFRATPDDYTGSTSPIVRDIMESPPPTRDSELVSPVSSQFASPLDSPVHGAHDPASSITSTPSHASGYKTPPENLVEMRRSSASPHIDNNFTQASPTYETDV